MSRFSKIKVSSLADLGLLRDQIQKKEEPVPAPESPSTTNNTEEAGMLVTAQNVTPKMARRNLDVIGPIMHEEGIDRAIWKTMMDRKARTIPEIIELITTYGFNRGEIDKRINVLVRKAWFEHCGSRGGKMSYALRKDITIPAIAEPSIRRTGSFSSNMPLLPSEVSMITRRQEEYQIHLTESNRAEEEAPSLVVASVDQPSETIMETPSTKHPKVLDTDSLKVAIWKVMSDFAKYTAADVAILLSERFTDNSVKWQISQLNIHHAWFIAERPDKRKPTTYQLLSDIPMPDDKPSVAAMRKAEPPATEEVAPDTTNDKQLSLIESQTPQEKKEDTMPAASNSEFEPKAILPYETDLVNRDAVAKNHPKPLLQMSVLIKGHPFTPSEARELLQELHACGFGEQEGGGNSRPMKYLNVKVTVRDIPMTVQEANELASELTLEFDRR